jgi:hypothetical protein
MDEKRSQPGSRGPAEPLTRAASLAGASTRPEILEACRQIAASLGKELRERGLAYQEVSLKAETERGTVAASRRFARHQLPDSLPLHLLRLAEKLPARAPVEQLTATVAGLSRASWEQPSLFGRRNPLREVRVQRALEEVNRKHRVFTAGALGAAWRERMLSFYDPFRWEARLR